MSREHWQELDEKATPGRWDLRITGHYLRIFSGGFAAEGDQLADDAEFIAAARTGWPAAERECVQLRAERDQALALLRRIAPFIRECADADSAWAEVWCHDLDRSGLLDDEGQQR